VARNIWIPDLWRASSAFGFARSRKGAKGIGANRGYLVLCSRNSIAFNYWFVYEVPILNRWMALDFGANAAMLGLSVWGWRVMGRRD
jgi:hypothetical protein